MIESWFNGWMPGAAVGCSLDSGVAPAVGSSLVSAVGMLVGSAL